MVSEDRRMNPAEFGAVDASAEPGGLIRLLDEANTVPGLRAAKHALLEQLALGGARAALDVGCGAGGDVAEMARLMPDGTQVSRIDASEKMLAEARQRTADLGTRVSLRIGDAAELPIATRCSMPAGPPPSCSTSGTRRASLRRWPG
jgi:SAM-dependent methyltransferase